MSNAVFLFSDEVGEYYPRPVPVKAANRYFVRGVVVIPATEWTGLRDRFRAIKSRAGLSEHREVKWAHCWSALAAHKNGDNVKSTKAHAYLMALSEEQILNLCRDLIEATVVTDKVKTFFLISKSNFTAHTADDVERWQIQSLMQRAQLEIASRPNALGVIAFDPINASVEKRLRRIYRELHDYGDSYLRYSKLTDCLNFQDSAQSVGIQAADLISGCFSGAMRGYAEARLWFDELIKPTLRSSPVGTYIGFGIVCVPTRQGVHKDVHTLLGLQ